MGPSGAGKSSIISLLEHFYEPKNGGISLDNLSIEQYDHQYFHQKVALVAQEPVLYDGSVRYNILYGCEEWANDEDMIQAAKLANIHDFVTETEKGYDTECGEKGVQMSGGQKVGFTTVISAFIILNFFSKELQLLGPLFANQLF